MEGGEGNTTEFICRFKTGKIPYKISGSLNLSSEINFNFISISSTIRFQKINIQHYYYLHMDLYFSADVLISNIDRDIYV